MAVIPFNSKFKKKKDIEICNGFMSNDTGIMTKFYRECRIPFEKAIRSTYGRDSINNVMTIDDIYSVSFTRLIDRFQRKFFVIEEDKILYKGSDEGYRPLSSSIANFLNSIGKNVFREMARTEESKIESNLEKIIPSSPTNEDDDETLSGDPVDDCAETMTGEVKDTILVWRIVDNMKEPCKTILDQSLTKHLSGKTDDDVAVELGYKSAEIVKSNRTRCKQKFKQVFLEQKKV
jgi:hypothetical protein